MSSPREWDASTYDRVSAPQEAWGREVLERLDLQGDERVLDAGCGTGRVTALLAERLPRGEVLAVDGSEAMVEETRRRLGGRVEAFASDLLDLELAEPGDAILKIGRASCRERVEISVGGVSLKKKKEKK